MPVDAHLRETMRLPSTIGGNLSAGGGLMRPWLQGVERGEGKFLRPLCVPSTSRRPPVVADQALARLHIIKRDAHAVPRHEISFVSVQWTSIVSLQAPGRGLIECLTVTGVARTSDHWNASRVRSMMPAFPTLWVARDLSLPPPGSSVKWILEEI